MMTSLNGGFGDGIPPVTGGRGHHQFLPLLGVGLLRVFVLLMGALSRG